MLHQQVVSGPHHQAVHTVTVPAQAVDTTAKQDSLRGKLGETDSSEEKLEENLSAILHSTQQRLEAPDTNPPTQSTGRSLNLSRDYNIICQTHKKLVKSGSVTCSVKLSDTPPKVDLPASLSTPLVVPSLLEGSVHWGAVGEFSGVQKSVPKSLLCSHSNQLQT